MSERTVVKKKKKWGKVYEYSPQIRASVLTEELAEEIQKDIKKATGITPQALATKHGIKVSLAKQILESMATKGELEMVHSNGKNKIYSK